jgi:hypothetical protein
VQPNAGASVHGKARLLFAIRTPIYRMVMKVGAINLARTGGAMNVARTGGAMNVARTVGAMNVAPTNIIYPLSRFWGC